MLRLAQQVSDHEGSVASGVKNAKLLRRSRRHINGHSCLLVGLQHHFRCCHVLVSWTGDLVHLWARLSAECERCNGLGAACFQNLGSASSLRCINNLWANAAVRTGRCCKHNLFAARELRRCSKHIRGGRKYRSPSWDVEANCLNRHCHATTLYSDHGLHSERKRPLLRFMETADVVVRSIQGSSHFRLHLRPRCGSHIDDQGICRQRCSIKVGGVPSHSSIAFCSHLFDDGFHSTFGGGQVDLGPQVELRALGSRYLAVLNQPDTERKVGVTVRRTIRRAISARHDLVVELASDRHPG
mmetsp:Transcript_61541/g.144188  ORF Transcript_61541/g.144188 Transcript_61541/m.144188 type:complete len:299 (+) Transcript_61541:659-1555(+)